jgi:hypothetical protein
MARKSVSVDRNKLINAINIAENKGPLGNLSLLWKATAEIYNQSNPLEPITPSVIYSRVQEFKISTKTVAGKRGSNSLSSEHKEAMQKARGKRQPKSEKFAKNPQIMESFDKISARTPERFQPLVSRMKKGSRKAADNLKCLDCCNWQPIEVKNCNTISCSLFAFRPYQSKNDDVEKTEEELI